MKTRTLDHAAVAELLKPRRSAFTREQLLASGVPRSVIDRAIRDGVIVAYLPGCYVVAGEPITWLTRVLATFLYVERQARRKWDRDAAQPLIAVTGVVAARLLGFPHIDADPDTIVLASNPRSRSKHALITERLSLTEGDLVSVDGASVTSIVWTVMELIAILLPSHMTNIVADLVRQGLLDLDILAATARRVPELRDDVEHFLTRLRVTDLAARSDAERRLLALIVRAGITAPLVNHVVGTSLRDVELDFAWLDCLLNVELDGPHHLLERQKRSDQRRDRALRQAGWTVIRVKLADFEADPAAVIAEIRKALDSCRADA